MLAVLTAAVAVCVTLTVLNLVLLFAVIRKLRDQPQQPQFVPQTMDVGTAVRRFETTTTTGATITEESLTSTVVAFVSPSCAPCRDLVASIREMAPRLRDPLLLVVVEELDDATRAAVAGVDGVTIVADEQSTAVTSAFGVSSYPTVARLEGRLVVRSGSQLADVLEPVAS
jgi:thiol-disulfide isomerase/thioredoxin